MADRPRPLPILDVSQDQWKINTRTFNSVLNKVRNLPIAIYSINGATRSGKSFLLNYFIRYFESIAINGTSSPQEPVQVFESKREEQRVTIGINLWSKPYIVKTREGEEVAVLLLDTQGLFDQATTYKQNAIIFTFSYLFSSVMMFNQKGLLTENILQDIERFSSFAKNIASRSSNQNSTSFYLSIESSNKLLLLLRDFDLPNYDYGLHTTQKKPETSQKNFFYYMFPNGNADSVKLPEENQVTRRRIQEIYREEGVATFLFPHPGNSFVRGRTQNPEQEFEDVALSFVKEAVSPENIVKKMIRRHVVTARQFRNCVAKIETVCKHSKDFFSDVHTMKNYHDHTQYFETKCGAFNYYKQQLKEVISLHPRGVSDQVLLSTHNEALARAIDIFLRTSRDYEPGLKEDYKSQLIQEAVSYYEEELETNTRHKNSLKASETSKKDIPFYLFAGAVAGAGIVWLWGPALYAAYLVIVAKIKVSAAAVIAALNTETGAASLATGTRSCAALLAVYMSLEAKMPN